MRIVLSIALVSALVLAGCAAPVKEQPRAGFLSSYDRLSKVDDQQYRYVSERLADYDRYTIAPIAVLVDFEEGGDQFSEEELDELKAYMVETLSEALRKDEGFQVAEGPGQGVLRYRLGITALDQSVGALNLSIYTRVTGAGLGGLAIELEAVDSLSGEQIYSTVRWGSGSRIMRAGFTKAGDAKILIKRWSRDLRRQWDAARGGGD